MNEPIPWMAPMNSMQKPIPAQIRPEVTTDFRTLSRVSFWEISSRVMGTSRKNRAETD